MLAVGAGGGCLDIFTLIYPFSPLSPSLWETARYRLKYCLKGPLNPKQPTNQLVSKAKRIMEKTDWSEKQKYIVRKELIFNSAVWEQLRAKTHETSKHQFHQMHKLVAGIIVKNTGFRSDSSII